LACGSELLNALPNGDDPGGAIAKFPDAGDPSGLEPHSVILERIYDKSNQLGKFLTEYVFSYQDAMEFINDCETAKLLLEKGNKFDKDDENEDEYDDEEGGSDSDEEDEDGDEGENSPKDRDKERFVSTFSFYRRNRLWSGKTLHRLRNALSYTFEAQLRGRFHVLHTVWGTNVHAAAPIEINGKPDFCQFRIADFMICSRRFQSCEIGVFQYPELGQGLFRVDGVWDKDEWLDFPHTNAWRRLSDHFPVGGIFSTASYDPIVNRPFVKPGSRVDPAVHNISHLLDFQLGIDTRITGKQLAEVKGEDTEEGHEMIVAQRFTLLQTNVVEWLEKQKTLEVGNLAKRLAQLDYASDPEQVAGLLRAVAARRIDSMKEGDRRSFIENLKKELKYSKIWPGLDEMAEERLDSLGEAIVGGVIGEMDEVVEDDEPDKKMQVKGKRKGPPRKVSKGNSKKKKSKKDKK